MIPEIQLFLLMLNSENTRLVAERGENGSDELENR